MGALGIGILGSIIATVITGAPVGLYRYIQKNKPIEEQLRKAFDKAVRRYFKDELQQEKVIYHDSDYYIALLKDELAGKHIDFESEKYKKLYSYFYEEINKEPALAHFVENAKQDLTVELIKSSAQEVQDALGGYAQQIIRKEDELKETLGQLFNLAELPSYGVGYIDETKDTKPLIELPEHTSKRAELTGKLSAQIDSYKIVILYGTKQIGKSTEAKLIAREYDSKIVECRDVSSFQFIKFAIQANVDATLIVLDNVLSKYVEQTIELISTYDLPNSYIITTDEAVDESLFNFKAQSIYQHEIPLLSEKECAEIIESYHPADDIQPIVSVCANQHPVLVQMTCQYLQLKNWEYDYDDLMKIFKGEHFQMLQRKIGKVLAEIQDTNARRLLNRLLLIHAPFTEEEVIALAGVEPKIDEPRLNFQRIQASWLSKLGEKHYVITPMLRSVWKPDMSRAERCACNRYMGDALINMRKLTDIESVRAISYYIDAEMYDMAGGVYVSILSSGKKIPEKSLLTLLWVGVELPKGMSVSVRFAVRVVQLLVLKNLPKEMQDMLYTDLMKIVDFEGTSIPNQVITYRLMSSICFFRDDIENGLRYHQLGASLKIDETDEQGALIHLSDEIGTYIQSGLWFLLMAIHDMQKFEEWLCVYRDTDQGKNKMMPMDYEGCYFFVWRYIDKYHRNLAIEEKIILLDELSAKAKAYNVTAIAIMAEFKKMDLYRGARMYPEMLKLYEQCMEEYKDEPLAILVFNATVGYGYYQEKKPEERDICLQYMQQALICSEEDILPAVNVHVREVMSYVQSETDKQQALQSMQGAYDYIQMPKHRVDPYDTFFALAELAHAKWLAGDKKRAIRDMSECVEFAYKELKTNSPYAKTYMCKCDCALLNYESELSGKALPADQASPVPGMYTELGDVGYEDLYTEKRLFTTAILMYMLCDELKIGDLKEKWTYKAIDIQKASGEINYEHGILQLMYPYLLEKRDITNAIYVSHITHQACVILNQEKGFNTDVEEQLIVMRLLPMLMVAVQEIQLHNDYTTYDRVHELLDDIEGQRVAITRELMQLPPEEITEDLIDQYEGGASYPMFYVIGVLLMQKEDLEVQKAFLMSCYLVQNIRKTCGSHYQKATDGLFDAFVVDYWKCKIQDMPEAFEGMERFWEKGIAKIEAEQDNKAKKCLQVLYNHVKDRDALAKVEDWLLE